MPPPDPIPGRLKAIQIVFPIIALVALIATWSSIADALFYSRVLDGEQIPDADYDATETRSGLISWLQFGSYVVGGIVFIRWLRPVYRYLDAIAPGTRRYEPQWVIWGWFVPVLWWWRPKQLINDVWKAGGGDLRAGLLFDWWALFVATGVISIVVGIATLGESTQDYRNYAIGLAVSYAIDFPAALLAIVVATRATRGLART